MQLTYIHQHPDWPHFTWDAEALASPLAAVRHEQGRHLGKMQALRFDLRTEADLEIRAIDVVKSWAIEGELIDENEVRSSLARRLDLDVAGLSAPSRSVDGVVQMMLDATQSFIDPVTPERLFGWHCALFPAGRTGVQRLTVGAWRSMSSEPMRVISGRVGRERVHFEAPSADRIDAEMELFFEWIDACDSTDPVLRAGLAHLWFVTIHPFDDGNGRIARALGDLALARADRASERYYSLSSQLEKERRDYYLQLERAQGGTLDVTTWLLWFLGVLDRSIGAADQTLARVIRKATVWQSVGGAALNERQRKVLNRLLDGLDGYLTTSKYAKMTRCSPDTSLRDIRRLVQLGILVQNPSGGRSTSYQLKS